MNSEQAVVVGWAEPLEEGQTVALRDLESKIGGAPMWIQEAGDPFQTSVNELNCEKCSQPLKFLMQVALQALAGVCSHRRE